MLLLGDSFYRCLLTKLLLNWLAALGGIGRRKEKEDEMILAEAARAKKEGCKKTIGNGFLKDLMTQRKTAKMLRVDGCLRFL